jgi:Holliday junction DNA helicase RuvA
MSLASVPELETAISRGDATVLTKVSGIGTKTAERLIVELREKVGADSDAIGGVGRPVGDSQAIDGLVALGYTTREARDALKAVSPDIEEAKDRIKAALKTLGTGG